MEKMNFNKQWSDIYLDQFSDLVKIDNDKELSNLERMVEKLTILYDSDEFDEMSVVEIGKIWKNHQWINDVPSNKIYYSVCVYKLTKFKKLTLGEWIDLDYWTRDLSNNLHKIFAVLYRKTKEDEWGNVIIEPYEFDVEVRSEEFNDFTIDKLYKALMDFIEYKNQVTKVYADIFKTGDEDADLTESEKENLTPEEIIEIERAIEKEKKINGFAWQLFVHNLCQEDLTKASDVLKLPALFVFNNNIMLKRVKE